MFVGKKFGLMLFVALSVFGVLLVESSCGAVEVKPAVPSFTVQEISQPYDVPPSTVTIVNPYTGEETTTNYPGHTVENKTIYLVVKNQPFTPYKNDKDEIMNLYYYYAYRGHYYAEEGGGWNWGSYEYYTQSDSEYTFIHFDGSMPSSGKIDIRMKAVIGTLRAVTPIFGQGGEIASYSFEGVESDYSVVTVSSDMLLSTTWPSSTVLPTSPENSDLSTSDNFNPPPPPQQQSPWATYLLIVVATVCIITILIVIVLYYNGCQQRKTKSHKHKSKQMFNMT